MLTRCPRKFSHANGPGIGYSRLRPEEHGPSQLSTGRLIDSAKCQAMAVGKPGEFVGSPSAAVQDSRVVRMAKQDLYVPKIQSIDRYIMPWKNQERHRKHATYAVAQVGESEIRNV
jgi:hypothetical protein